MPAPGRIRISKNSQLTTPLLDYRGYSNNFIEWNGQFQITEFENDDYLEFDFVENEWYFNLYATLPGTYLNDLLDVTITSVTDKDTLSYNILTQQWENSGRLTQSEQDISNINTEISNINNDISNINTEITNINGDISNINQTINNNQTTIQNQITEINSNADPSIGGFVPEGGIIMWSGSVVPTDWVLCDGDNNTPDLTDRFIIGTNLVGIGPNGVGSPADATTLSFTIDQDNLPPHSHSASVTGNATGTTNVAGSHTHVLQTDGDGTAEGTIDNDAGNFDDYGRNSNAVEAAGDHSHTVSVDLSTASITVGGGNFNNDPIQLTISPKKYYKLAFIMRKYSGSTSTSTFSSTTTVFNDPLLGGSIGNENQNQGPFEFQQNLQD